MKGLFYIIGEISIGLICLYAEFFMIKTILLLLLNLTLDSVLISLALLLIVIGIGYRFLVYIEHSQKI